MLENRIACVCGADTLKVSVGAGPKNEYIVFECPECGRRGTLAPETTFGPLARTTEPVASTESNES